MRLLLMILILTGSVYFTACRQREFVDPSFEVSTSKTAYRVGDTVVFNLTGNPDFLMFYSGVPGKTYDPAKPLGGVFLKGMDSRIDSYSFVYSSAGTFAPTFLGATNNRYKKSETTRQLQLFITP